MFTVFSESIKLKTSLWTILRHKDLLSAILTENKQNVNRWHKRIKNLSDQTSTKKPPIRGRRFGLLFDDVLITYKICSVLHIRDSLPLAKLGKLLPSNNNRGGRSVGLRTVLCTITLPAHRPRACALLTGASTQECGKPKRPQPQPMHCSGSLSEPYQHTGRASSVSTRYFMREDSRHGSLRTDSTFALFYFLRAHRAREREGKKKSFLRENQNQT